MDSLLTNVQAQVERRGYRQFIYTKLFPPLSTIHTHTHWSTFVHTYTPTDISLEAEWNISVYLCERRLVINQLCVSSSNQSHLLIVTNCFRSRGFLPHPQARINPRHTTRTLVISIPLSRRFHANFWNVTQNQTRIKWFSINWGDYKHRGKKQRFF